MKIRGRKSKVFFGLLFWVITVWAFAMTAFAAPPKAANLKWGGELGLTAYWDLDRKYDDLVYVQLKRNGEAVTSFKRVPNFQNYYDFSEDFAEVFLNGTYTFVVKVRDHIVNGTEVVVESSGLKFEMEKYLQFKDQYPAFNAGQDEQIIRVKVGDTLTFKFNNVPLPEPFAEKYYVFKTCGLTYWTGGKDVPKTEDANNNYHDHIPVEFKYTFTETGTAYILEQLSYTDKNFGSSSYEKKGYTYSISRKFCIVVEPKPCSHDYQELSNTATCTASGEKNMQCRLCGDAVTEYVSALQHDVVSSYQYDSATHWKACERCYETVTELPHNYDSKGFCKDCGFSNSCEPEYMSHNCDEQYHWYECIANHSGECPSNHMLEKQMHRENRYTEPGQSAYSCQNGYVCEECLWYFGPKGQHKWVMDEQASVPATFSSEGKAVYRCAYDGMLDGRNYEIRCSAVKTIILKKLTHSWDYTKVLKDTATCTKDGKKTFGCKDSGCKETLLIVSQASGHTFNYANICTVCGYKHAGANAESKQIVMTDKKTKTKYMLDLRDKTSGSVLYLAPKNKKITKVVIPPTVKLNGLNYKVSGIADNAFRGCKKLKTVTIGKNVNMIGERAFEKCKVLKQVTIPAKVKTIGKRALYGCKSLKTIRIATTKLTADRVGAKAFEGVYSRVSVKVPAKKLKAYKKLLIQRGISRKAKIGK